MRALRKSLRISLFFAGLVWSMPMAQALGTMPYTPPLAQSTSPVIVSGYGFNGTNVMYVQLFNKSDEVVDLAGWQLEYWPAGGDDYVLLVQLKGLLRPSNYVLAAETGLLEGAEYVYALPTVGGEVFTTAASLRLLPVPQYKPEDIKLPTKQEVSYWQRNVSASTGNYLSTFTSFVPAEDYKLYAGGLYAFPETTGLQISEILANPRDCSPIDIALDCHDYVKLYNPTAQPVDLSAFRLRSGYQGQDATSSNTYLLSGLLQPGHYMPVMTAADGHSVALTNSGGYVWLEDIYGMKLYDMTVQAYPDASSDSRKGQAWAYNEADDSWAWTAAPTPADAPSVFVAAAAETATGSSLVPCQPDQYRSPETNRCRLLPVPGVTSLAACSPGQYRNPLTNRCRSIEAAFGTLTPCAPNEERNLATNRCRQMAGTEPTLVPCKPNQERNPETNRCRNKTAPTDFTAPFPVEPVKQTGESFTGWWVLGGLGVVAIGYGVWEWHQELLAVGRRVARYLPPFK